MRLADYTNKLFDFLARSLRRLAEFVSVKPPTENQSFGDEKLADPLADWLERTKDIPPEQWIDFSGEATDNSAIVLPEDDAELVLNTKFSVNRSVEDEKYFIKDVEKAASDRQKPEIQTESKKTSVNYAEIPLSPTPKKASRFLSFSFAEKNRNIPAEDIKISSQTSRKSPTENEKSTVLPKPKFKLSSALPIVSKKPKTTLPALSNEETGATETPESNKDLPIFEAKKSGKNEVTTPQEIKLEHQKQTQIISVPVNRKNTEKMSAEQIIKSTAKAVEKTFDFSTPKFSDETKFNFSTPKLSDETAFDFSTPNASSDFGFEPASGIKKEFPVYIPNLERNTPHAPENKITKQRRQNEKTVDNFTFAAPPWIDLPDELMRESLMEISLSRSDIQHLLDLEREQAGRKKQNNY